MSVQIIHDKSKQIAAFYCSTSDVAFGPVFIDTDDHDGEERAEAFLRWLSTTDTWHRYEKELQTGRRDPRLLTEQSLSAAYSDWLTQESDQWAREDAALFAEETD
jgi:hypothetical protein